MSEPTLKFGVFAALVLGFIGLLSFLGVGFHKSLPGTFGASGSPSNVYPNALWFPNGLKIGYNGTFNTQNQFGTCTLIEQNSHTFQATTTIAMDCAVTGVKSGDIVEIGANGTYNSWMDQVRLDPLNHLIGWVPIGGVASTTGGFVTVYMENMVGTATVTPANSSGVSTLSVSYFIKR